MERPSTVRGRGAQERARISPGSNPVQSVNGLGGVEAKERAGGLTSHLHDRVIEQINKRAHERLVLRRDAPRGRQTDSRR